MSRIGIIILLTALITSGSCFAQSNIFPMEGDDQWREVSTTHRLSDFPKINEKDGRLWFRFEAPETAQSVSVHFDGEDHEMQQDEGGLWNVVISDPEPGFQIYWMNVDGARVIDPGTNPVYMGEYVNAVDVPGPNDEFYQAKQVPHGDVREHWFYSNVTGEFRRMFVYTPPGYEQNSNQRYPVLYLQHGGGENETEWTHSGKANFILDNLIAGGKAQPMIIVMNNGFATRANPAERTTVRGYQPGWANTFEDMMVNEVIPDIDATYRTITNPQNRAIAGLSMGGGQAFYVGLGNIDIFGSVGVFGSGLFGGIQGPGGEFNAEEHIPGLITKSESFNKALDLFYMAVGEQDMRIDHTKKAVATFRENGLEVEYASFPGDHEWNAWRSCLHHFAQLLF